MEHAHLARIIAHRGASADAPENTLSAFSLAAVDGASCVELDVQISSDDIAYVHHDHKLDRCTDGQGLLCEHTSEQLDLLRAGKNNPGFELEPLPRLSTTIELLKSRQLGLNLEIKPVKGLEQRTVDAIFHELENAWPTQLPLVISSFNHESLGMIKQRMPHVATALLFGAIPDDWQASMQHYNAQNIHCAANELVSNAASDVVGAGYGLYCYTVNEATKAKAVLGLGAHGIFTDYPKSMATQLES